MFVIVAIAVVVIAAIMTTTESIVTMYQQFGSEWA